MGSLTLGVLARTRKENEQRLPIHPLHLDRLDPGLAQRVFLEVGYGHDFGISDEQLAKSVGGVRSRADLIKQCDVILLLKPDPRDLAELREGQVLWGWPHCVQDRELTQQAIDRRQTLLAFEAMNLWSSDGSFKLHVFHQNNEIAGYASVLHALQLIGSTGTYGRRLTAVVLGFGSTGRGAVKALDAIGVNNIDVLTNRAVGEVASPIHPTQIMQFDADEAVVQTDDGKVALAPFLGVHDVVVNCVLQDPNAPLIFLHDEDLEAFRSGSLIIDVSCDEGMGFSWARPTSFAEPTFVVGENITYYAVDHSPSYLWNAATWEISEALLPYLDAVLDGPEAWQQDPTLKRALEIQDGHVINPDILSFQNRSADFPHAPR